MASKIGKKLTCQNKSSGYFWGMKTLELFSGKGTISSALSEVGFHPDTLDIRKRKGVCEPTIREDLAKLPLTYWEGKKYGVVWASVPCTAHSVAGGNQYFDSLMPNERAEPFIKLLEKTLKVIELINPEYYFLENPRGRMRYSKSLVDFLARTGGMLKETAWGLYGAPILKPTDIFTNALDFVPLSGFKWGRGAKFGDKRFDTYTLVQVQSIPELFAKDLATYLERKLIKGDAELSIEYPSTVQVPPDSNGFRQVITITD